MVDETLNGDLGAFVAVATADMPWAPSPSPSVWRKRLHRVGPQEAGQVTSIVRYDADSSFPVHEHPDGEEILVLEGIFTDDRGDWPAGTYLLNPEGYRHAPSSREGCVIFVKLRQFPGLDRQQVAIDTADLDWQPSDFAGIAIKRLYSQAGYRDSTRLERWDAGAGPIERIFEDGAEIFIIDGTLSHAAAQYVAGTWLRYPTGTVTELNSKPGCTLYLKLGGQRYLQSADAI